MNNLVAVLKSSKGLVVKGALVVGTVLVAVVAAKMLNKKSASQLELAESTTEESEEGSEQ